MLTVCTLTKCTAEFKGTTTGTVLALRFHQISPTARGANSPFNCVAVPSLKTGERPRPAAEFQKIIDNLWISSYAHAFAPPEARQEDLEGFPTRRPLDPSRSVSFCT